MAPDPDQPPSQAAIAPVVSRADVASGAALSGLARMGAIIEIVTQPAFVWMFGLATYGTYIVLWAAVNVIATLMALSLPQALQRIENALTGQHLEGCTGRLQGDSHGMCIQNRFVGRRGRRCTVSRYPARPKVRRRAA